MGQLGHGGKDTSALQIPPVEGNKKRCKTKAHNLSKLRTFTIHVTIAFLEKGKYKSTEGCWNTLMYANSE